MVRLPVLPAECSVTGSPFPSPLRRGEGGPGAKAGVRVLQPPVPVPGPLPPSALPQSGGAHLGVFRVSQPGHLSAQGFCKLQPVQRKTARSLQGRALTHSQPVLCGSRSPSEWITVLPSGIFL